MSTSIYPIAPLLWVLHTGLLKVLCLYCRWWSALKKCLFNFRLLIYKDTSSFGVHTLSRLKWFAPNPYTVRDNNHYDFHLQSKSWSLFSFLIGWFCPALLLVHLCMKTQWKSTQIKEQVLFVIWLKLTSTHHSSHQCLMLLTAASCYSLEGRRNNNTTVY